MPDTTGPASTDLTVRLDLIKSAPPPPDSWLRAQVDDDQTRRRRATPTELDVRWRIRWADTVLRLNAR